MNKSERDRLIKAIRKASGVAEYALRKKLSDEQIIEASQHLEILLLLKDANNYNRYTQGQKTKKANQQTREVTAELEQAKEKLKFFLNPQNSEIFSAGKWLINALSKKGDTRKQMLLEKELFHKDDRNSDLAGMREVISDMNEVANNITKDSKQKIQILESRIDNLREQLSKIKDYISLNYGASEWKKIADTFNIK